MPRGIPGSGKKSRKSKASNASAYHRRGKIATSHLREILTQQPEKKAALSTAKLLIKQAQELLDTL